MDWGRHLIVEPDAALAATYRRAPRGEAWADVSGRVRIATLVCAVCERRPPTIGGLDGAHLVSEFEMFLIGREFRDRFLLDERNLRPLCRADHRVLDAFLGVLAARRMPRGTVARLARRFRRYEPEFRGLMRVRMRFLALALGEVDHATTAASELATA